MAIPAFGAHLDVVVASVAELGFFCMTFGTGILKTHLVLLTGGTECRSAFPLGQHHLSNCPGASCERTSCKGLIPRTLFRLFPLQVSAESELCRNCTKTVRDKDEKDYDPNDYLACVIHPRPPRLHSASEVRLEDRFLSLFPLS